MPLSPETDSKDMWNAEAKSWAAKPDASFASDGFLQRLGKKVPHLSCARVLDIGCGPGRYAVPLAARCTHYTGSDISECMIAAAKDRCAKAGVDNTSFVCTPFDIFAVPLLKPFGPFDIVMAHNCPAVSSREDFSRMTQLSSGLCLWQCWITRTDPIIEIAREIAGVGPAPQRTETYETLKAYLNDCGKPFETSIFDDPHRSTYTVEEAFGRGSRRVPARFAEDPAFQAELRAQLEKRSCGGLIANCMETTSAFACWRI